MPEGLPGAGAHSNPIGITLSRRATDAVRVTMHAFARNIGAHNQIYLITIFYTDYSDMKG